MSKLQSVLQKRINNGSSLVHVKKLNEQRIWAANLDKWRELKHTIITKTGMSLYEKNFIAPFELNEESYKYHDCTGNYGINRMILALPMLMPIAISYHDCATHDISLLRAKGDFKLTIFRIIVLNEGRKGDYLLGHSYTTWFPSGVFFKDEEFSVAFDEALYYAKKEYNFISKQKTMCKITNGQFYARSNCSGDCDPRL